MVILSGFSGDSIQKTHPWHSLNIDRATITPNNALKVNGRDISKIKDVWCGLFHMPIFGGWKSYVVLKPKKPIKVWFIGWKTKRLCQINIIPLSGMVKMLTSIKGTETLFFGMDKDKNIIELEVVDFGENGDKKFKNVPLL